MIGTRISDGGSDEATSIGLEGSSDHVLVLLVLCQPEKTDTKYSVLSIYREENNFP